MNDEQFKKLETAATVIEDLKKELRKCMLEKITELTDEKMVAITFTINGNATGGTKAEILGYLDGIYVEDSPVTIDRIFTHFNLFILGIKYFL